MAPGNAWSVHSPVTREISRYRSSVGSPNLDIKALLTCRSAVDQVTVNHPVVGSIPTMSANFMGRKVGKRFQLDCSLSKQSMVLLVDELLVTRTYA